jgi:uncharacterized membrane protein
MRVLAKTFGWLVVSGLIIFISNLSAGVDWKVALVGAAVAKIATTIAYFLYEVGFEKAWQRQPKATTVTATATPCPCPA